MKQLSVRNMVQIAILGAMANVLHLLRFPLPFMPPFMDFDISGAPEIIGVFTMGPISGMFIVIVKILLKLMLSGTTSMFTGELQTFILGCAYVIPAGLIYQHRKNRKFALIGMSVSTLTCCMMAVFSNMFIIIPFYTKMYGMSIEDIVALTQAVNPFVDSTWKFVILGVVPFNLLKYGVTSLVVYSMYPIMMRIVKRENYHAV